MIRTVRRSSSTSGRGRRGPVAAPLLGWTVVMVIVAVLLAPQVIVIAASFTTTRSMTFPPQGFTLDWYREMVAYQPFVTSIRTSAQVALGATMLSLVLGTAGALAVARHRFPGRAALSTFFLSPLVVPTIIIGFAVFEFMRATNLAFTLRGLILAHVVITFPYVFRSVLVSVQTVDRALEEAAMSLRANPFQVFTRVTLPAIRPGLLAGAIFAFIVSFDDLVVSMFLTGPTLKTLPVVMFGYTSEGLDPTIAAISTVLIGAATVLVVVLEKTFGFSRIV